MIIAFFVHPLHVFLHQFFTDAHSGGKGPAGGSNEADMFFLRDASAGEISQSCLIFYDPNPVALRIILPVKFCKAGCHTNLE